MKVTISTGKLVLALLVASLFGFFYIFHTSSIIYSGDLINVAVISLTIIAAILTNGCILTNKYTKKYTPWIIFTVFMCSIQIIHSYIAYYRYGQTLVQVLSVAYTMLSAFSFFAFSYYQEIRKDIDCLKDMVIDGSLVASILSILQVVAYNKGIIFLDIGTISANSIRNGTLRFGIGSYVVVLALMMTLFDAINSSEHRMRNILYSFVYAVYFIYAVKTRSLQLYFIATIYLVVLFGLKRKNARILLIFIGIIVILYLVLSRAILYFITDLSTDSGFNMRFNTIAYYWKEFIEHPILGMGYIKNSTASPELLTLSMGPLYYGTTRYYYQSDVGFIGLLNIHGIIGAIWYIWALILLFRECKTLYKVDPQCYTWCIASWLFIVICSINLIYTNATVFPVFIMLMALIHHYYINESEGKYIYGKAYAHQA